jgi:hypothetical protein
MCNRIEPGNLSISFYFILHGISLVLSAGAALSVTWGWNPRISCTNQLPANASLKQKEHFVRSKKKMCYCNIIAALTAKKHHCSRMPPRVPKKLCYYSIIAE